MHPFPVRIFPVDNLLTRFAGDEHMTLLREVVESPVRPKLVRNIAGYAPNWTGKLPDRIEEACFLFSGRFACPWLEGSLGANPPWAKCAP